VATLLRAVLLLLVVCGVGPSAVSAQVSVPALRAAGASKVRDVYLRFPRTTPNTQPLKAVIALHGMGGSGHDFGALLTAEADRYGWLLIAPTIDYGDWTDHRQIRREDPALIAWLSEFISSLSHHAEYPVEPTVLLFGHSRGAQLALRFAQVHPEQTAGVAAASAGTYTLPFTRDNRSGRPIEFPFGMAHLARDVSGHAFDVDGFTQVPIWVGVGADDTNPHEVPDAWDPYIGDDRLDRAEAYTAALRALGVDVTLEIFQSTDHGLTDTMRSVACAALAAN